MIIQKRATDQEAVNFAYENASEALADSEYDLTAEDVFKNFTDGVQNMLHDSRQMANLVGSNNDSGNGLKAVESIFDGARVANSKITSSGQTDFDGFTNSNWWQNHHTADLMIQGSVLTNHKFGRNMYRLTFVYFYQLSRKRNPNPRIVALSYVLTISMAMLLILVQGLVLFIPELHEFVYNLFK